MNILEKIEQYYDAYSGEKGTAGYSVENRPIRYFAVEKSSRPVIIVQYSIHAREYITSYLALKQIEDFIDNGKRGKVYFLPAVNPDGISICLSGRKNYKANANGVDLNVNFDAGWGTGSKNVLSRGEENCIGDYPFSEKESRALRDFTLRVMPDATASYHSKGEEIYWEFGQTGENYLRDEKIASRLAAVTGYSAKIIKGSAGGYKDWCIKRLKIPSFTVEVGDDDLMHPIGPEHADEIFFRNKEVLNVLTESL